ncbi:MAG: hypothetical protein VB080_16020 [Propionicimonas sp.]|uniref:hypothetical protein n=1 Tax=Propionicimonas sp. TaxID=1955623 RepID=UPI002B20267A|nr:hypothetical protein [Propionicimonas sp.]MEA4945928.1 hypothetical protein [Propionicimonas sp.]MEA5116421.1 hypothetical protein [Propionicimonas sp.]
MGLPRRIRKAAVAVVTAVGLLAACQTATPAPFTPSPSRSTASPSPSPTPTPTPLDFTRPGLAEAWLKRLLATVGSDLVVMAEVTTDSVTVTVLPEAGGKPVTWAYRDGQAQQVTSDLEYVDQAVFNLDDFDLSDVGSLFRTAARISGSTANQTLHIVDFSGGRVAMTVTTNPESRTVFFQPDGIPLPELDYHTAAGVADGLSEVTRDRVTVQMLGVDSETGAWVDYAGLDDTTVRLQRTAKVPVTRISRDEVLSLPPFAVDLVDPAVIWQVVSRIIRQAGLEPDTRWQVTVDDRGGTGVPRLYFTVGSTAVTTDLAGTEVISS